MEILKEIENKDTGFQIDKSLFEEDKSFVVCVENSIDAERIKLLAEKHNRDYILLEPETKELYTFDPLTLKTHDLLKIIRKYKFSKDDEKHIDEINLLTNLVYVFKEYLADETFSLKDVLNLSFNIQGLGKKYIARASRKSHIDKETAIKCLDICNWFYYEYFSDDTDTFQRLQTIRAKISSLAQTTKNGEIIDFYQVVSDGKIVIINMDLDNYYKEGELFGQVAMDCFEVVLKDKDSTGIRIKG